MTDVCEVKEPPRRKLALWYAAAAACSALIAGYAAHILMRTVYQTTVCRVESFEKAPALHQWVYLSVLAIVVAGVYAAVMIFTGRARARFAMLSWTGLFLLPLIFIWKRQVPDIGPFFLEPVILAVACGATVWVFLNEGRSASTKELSERSSLVPGVAIVAVGIAAAAWMYHVQNAAVESLTFGWRDAGLYYARVKNTCLGLGFLREVPSKPPFYDHFGPGLLFLAPFYWIFGSYHVILWAQSLGLAALAPAVYIYARGRGLSGWAAFLFALAAVLHPSVTQMAYSFSYGFHPVTPALPFVVLSIHFWEKRRWTAFAVVAVIAASFEETLFPLYAGVGLVTSAAALLKRRKGGASPAPTSDAGAGLPAVAGGAPASDARAGAILFAASALLFVIITKVVMPAFAGKAYFQLAKYPQLGDSFTAILLSPVTRPAAFWGTLFSMRSMVFVTLILGGGGFLALFSPKRLLYPAVVLVFVLLLDNPTDKSISLWYQALIVAAWLPAAAAGAERLCRWGGASVRAGGAAAGWAAVTAAFVMAHFYGLTPFSRVTMPFQTIRHETSELRAIAAKLGSGTRVLATNREAMLFADCLVTTIEDWDGSTDCDVAVFGPASSFNGDTARAKEACDALVATHDYEAAKADGALVLVRRRPFSAE